MLHFHWYQPPFVDPRHLCCRKLMCMLIGIESVEVVNIVLLQFRFGFMSCALKSDYSAGLSTTISDVGYRLCTALWWPLYKTKQREEKALFTCVAVSWFVCYYIKAWNGKQWFLIDGSLSLHFVTFFLVHLGLHGFLWTNYNYFFYETVIDRTYS